MSLSKVNSSPIYTTKLPSTGKVVKFRPFVVKEERALLTAEESEDVNTMFVTLEQVVRNCMMDYSGKLTTFDIEWMFVQIRSKSVGETTEVTIKCKHCEKESSNEVNLKTVQVITPPDHQSKIELGEDHYVTMKYPELNDLLDITSAKTSEEQKAAVVKSCISAVFHQDETYTIAEESEEEINGYIESLRSDQYKKLKRFVDTVPYVSIKHKWECSHCKSVNEIELKGLLSFF